MFLALRDIKFATGRFALMGSVVALLSLLLVLLTGLTSGLGHQSTSAIDDLHADHVVFGAARNGEAKVSFSDSQINASQLERWQQAARADGGTVDPLGISQGKVTGTGDGSASTAVTFFGVEPSSPLPPAKVADGEIVLSQNVADTLGAGEGSSVTINEKTLKVAAVAPDQWYSHTPVVWTSTNDWRAFSHSPKDTVATVLATSSMSNTDSLTADTATTSETLTGARAGLASYKSENGSLMMMQGFLYGISALVVVAFLSVWTVQRTRDVAVLRALGASTRYVLLDALSQAAIVLLIGTAIGVALGTGLGAIAARVVPFQLDVLTVALPAVGIMVLGMAAALLAVRQVTKIDPLIALGGN